MFRDVNTTLHLPVFDTGMSKEESDRKSTEFVVTLAMLSKARKKVDGLFSGLVSFHRAPAKPNYHVTQEASISVLWTTWVKTHKEYE